MPAIITSHLQTKILAPLESTARHKEDLQYTLMTSATKWSIMIPRAVKYAAH